MSEKIEQIKLPSYKAQSLADRYMEMTNYAFKPNPIALSPQEQRLTRPEFIEASEKMRQEMYDMLRESFVNMFLGLYKTGSLEGVRPIDGIEYDGKHYGKSIKEALKAGRDAIVVKWEDLPQYLGFEKFLTKTP